MQTEKHAGLRAKSGKAFPEMEQGFSQKGAVLFFFSSCHLIK
jgi:hypothetical protein